MWSHWGKEQVSPMTSQRHWATRGLGLEGRQYRSLHSCQDGHEPGVVTHDYNPRTQEAEARRSQQGQSCLRKQGGRVGKEPQRRP